MSFFPNFLYDRVKGVASLAYKRVTLNEVIVVNQIITFHYYELPSSYVTKGERHDFWEFVYVDKGELDVRSDSGVFSVKQGEVVFYKPNEFHSGSSNAKYPPNLIIMTFDCNSEAMKVFENQRFRVDEQERKWLTLLVNEGYNALAPRLDKPYKKQMKVKNDPLFGSEQLVKIYLETLLIHFARRLRRTAPLNKLDSTMNEKKDSDLTSQIIAFMNRSLHKSLTLKDIYSNFTVGRSQILRIFKAKTGYGMIEYFNRLKIEQAKILIREEQYNYTEIAERLGYSSIHYFSRHFKRSTGMTPTSYARSVKARIVNHR